MFHSNVFLVAKCTVNRYFLIKVLTHTDRDFDNEFSVNVKNSFKTDDWKNLLKC